MHRFFVPCSEVVTDGSFQLPKSEAHHALSALRIRPGDRVVVLDGEGGEFECEVESAGRRDVTLKALESKRHERPAKSLTLVQAIVKGKAMDLIVQKATELGATRIVPLLTERTVARPAPSDFQAKTDKWRGIAIEAIKQCGSTWLPEIDIPTELAQFAATVKKFDLSLVAALDETTEEAACHFDGFLEEQKSPPESVSVWIGPEGDFSPGEMKTIRGNGALPISLGPLTLRSETAALCALSVIAAEMRRRN